MTTAFTTVPTALPGKRRHPRINPTPKCCRSRPRMCADSGRGGATSRNFSPGATQVLSVTQPPVARLFGDSLKQGIRRDGAPATRAESDARAKARAKTKTRVRQHLNPLAARWRGDVQLSSDWYEKAFSSVHLPLVVDVGCAKGRFAERLATADASRNVLGLEIREPLVDEANLRARERGLRNISFLACNANVSLAQVLDHAADGALDTVLLQFCDPWFKKRHAKRRMVDAALTATVHDALRKADAFRPAKRVVFLQSDVEPLAEEMRAHFDRHSGFVRDEDIAWTDKGWLTQSPLPQKTEREICVERRGEPVYRAQYTLARAGWEPEIGRAAAEPPHALAPGSRAELSDGSSGSSGSEDAPLDVFAD